MVQTRSKQSFSEGVVLPGVGIAVVMAATAYPPALVGTVTPGAVLRLLFLFPALLLLPGYLLDALLRLTGDEVTPAAPAVWLALSCGVLAPAGWAVLALHTPLTSFGWVAAGTLAGLAGLRLLLRARTYDYPLAMFAAFFLSALAGGAALWVVNLLPFNWLIMLVLAPAIAGGIAEAVRRLVGKRRGRSMWLVAAGAAAAGALLGLGMVWLFTGALPLILFLIFVVFLVSTFSVRLR